MSCTKDTSASVPEALLCALVRKQPSILTSLTQTDMDIAGVTWAEADEWLASHADADAKALQAT